MLLQNLNAIGDATNTISQNQQTFLQMHTDMLFVALTCMNEHCQPEDGEHEQHENLQTFWLIIKNLGHQKCYQVTKALFHNQNF